MIEFKPVRLEDKQTIERYTMPSGIYNCDLAFANMYCWQAMYHSAWAVIDGFLVIRFQIGGGEKIGYMQPVGEGDFARIIPALREDAHAHGQRLRIIGLTDEGREMVRNMHAGLFAFESDRGMEDYVYNADDLRNLTGRRYQPKRNHINRFMAEYPDFRYEQLTRERFGECMQLEREWRRAHEGHTSELCAEQRAMQRAFEHFEELEMIGGCIYVGDKLIAFTYGSAVNDHTFDTHVEKADTDYDGAFTIINKLFAQHLPARFTMINREEDLGILEGLRVGRLPFGEQLGDPDHADQRRGLEHVVELVAEPGDDQATGLRQYQTPHRLCFGEPDHESRQVEGARAEVGCRTRRGRRIVRDVVARDDLHRASGVVHRPPEHADVVERRRERDEPEAADAPAPAKLYFDTGKADMPADAATAMRSESSR